MPARRRRRRTVCSVAALFAIGSSFACRSDVISVSPREPGDRVLTAIVGPRGDLHDLRVHAPSTAPIVIAVASNERVARWTLPESAFVSIDGSRGALGEGLEAHLKGTPSQTAGSCGRCAIRSRRPPQIVSPGDRCPLPPFVTGVLVGVDGEEPVTKEIQDAIDLAWPGACTCGDRPPAGRLDPGEAQLVLPRSDPEPFERWAINDEGAVALFGPRIARVIDRGGGGAELRDPWPAHRVLASAAMGGSFYVALARGILGRGTVRLERLSPSLSIESGQANLNKIRQISGDLIDGAVAVIGGTPTTSGTDPAIAACSLDLKSCPILVQGLLGPTEDAFVSASRTSEGVVIVISDDSIALLERLPRLGETVRVESRREGPSVVKGELIDGAGARSVFRVVSGHFVARANDGSTLDGLRGYFSTHAIGTRVFVCGRPAPSRRSFVLTASISLADVRDQPGAWDFRDRFTGWLADSDALCTISETETGGVRAHFGGTSIEIDAGGRFGTSTRLGEALGLPRDVVSLGRSSAGDLFAFDVASVVYRRGPGAADRFTPIYGDAEQVLGPIAGIASTRASGFYLFPQGQPPMRAALDGRDAPRFEDLMIPDYPAQLTVGGVAAHPDGGSVLVVGARDPEWREPVAVRISGGDALRAEIVGGLSPELGGLIDVAALAPDRFVAISSNGALLAIDGEPPRAKVYEVDLDDPETPAVESEWPSGRCAIRRARYEPLREDRRIWTDLDAGGGVVWAVGCDARIARITTAGVEVIRLERWFESKHSLIVDPPAFVAARALCANQLLVASAEGEGSLEDLLYVIDTSKSEGAVTQIEGALSGTGYVACLAGPRERILIGTDEVRGAGDAEGFMLVDRVLSCAASSTGEALFGTAGGRVVWIGPRP